MRDKTLTLGPYFGARGFGAALAAAMLNSAGRDNISNSDAAVLLPPSPADSYDPATVLRAPEPRPFRTNWRRASAGELWVGGRPARTCEELRKYDAHRKATKAARREAWQRGCGRLKSDTLSKIGLQSVVDYLETLREATTLPFVFTRAHAQHVIRVIGEVHKCSGATSLPCPDGMGPTSGDGLQVVWDSADHHVELDIFADGTFDWFYRDRRAGAYDGTCHVVRVEQRPRLVEALAAVLKQKANADAG